MNIYMFMCANIYRTYENEVYDYLRLNKYMGCTYISRYTSIYAYLIQALAHRASQSAFYASDSDYCVAYVFECDVLCNTRGVLAVSVPHGEDRHWISWRLQSTGDRNRKRGDNLEVASATPVPIPTSSFNKKRKSMHC